MVTGVLYTNLMKTGLIYTLSDPVTQEIRYVGRTIMKPHHRLSCHLNVAKNKVNKYHTANWIRSLQLKGLKPIMEIVQEMNDNYLGDAEIFWIDYFKNAMKCDLTNTSSGGEKGSIGFKHTDAFKARMSELHKGNSYCKGRKHTEEWKKANSERMKIRMVGVKQPWLGEANKREYIVITPEDEVIEVYGMRQYCIENNLAPGNMCNVAKGNLKHTKGYKCYYKEDYKS